MKLTAAHFDLQTLIQRTRWISSNWRRSQLRKLKSWQLLTLIKNGRWVSNWKREGGSVEMKTSFARTGWIFTQPFCRARSLGNRHPPGSGFVPFWDSAVMFCRYIFSEGSKNTLLEGAAAGHVYGDTCIFYHLLEVTLESQILGIWWQAHLISTI